MSSAKKGVFILIVGLLLGAAAYGCVYFVCTTPTRTLQENSKPELAWLKDEFHLDDAEFKRVAGLHAAYLPQCAEMCREIDAQSQRLKQLLASTNQVTPEIKAAITENARLRAECQSHMIKHFYEVSRSMPPEQGRRYLAWVQEKTCWSNDSMMRDN
jgi:hypothetical protein